MLTFLAVPFYQLL